MRKMNSFIHIMGFLFFSFLIFGCSPAVNKVYLLSDKLPPKPKNHPIKIFQNKLPECPFEEVGYVTSRQRNKLISMESVMESVRDAAREMGGDAVMNLTWGEQNMGGVVSNNAIVIDHDPVLSGTIIRWTEENCKK